MEVDALFFFRFRWLHIAYESAQRAEFVFFEEIGDLCIITAGNRHILSLDVKCDISLYGHKLMAESYVVSGVFESLPLFRSEFPDMFIYISYSAVFPYKLACSNLSDSLHSRDIVRGVAAYRQYLDNLFRLADTVFLTDFLRVYKFDLAACLAGLVLDNGRRDQLAVILVRRNHICREAFLLGALGHGTDYIVGLVTSYHQYRNLQSFAQFRQRFKRIYHQLGRLGTCSLVFRIHFVSECTSGRVEGYRYVCRLLSFYKFQDVFGESEENGHVSSLGIDHGASEKCIIHLENQSMSIN